MKKFLNKFYPLLLACYPILALRNYNITYVNFATIIRSLVFTIIGSFIILLLLQLAIHDWAKSSVLTSVLLVVIFSYGHLYNFLVESTGLAIQHRYLASAYFIVFSVSAIFILRNNSVAESSRTFLVTVSVVLFCMVSAQSLWFDYSAYHATRELALQDSETQTAKVASLPDIYLIVLDGHARSDVLFNIFEYDNSFFVEELERLGFYVAHCSQSNYASTKLSLTSIFNAGYIQQMYGQTTVLPPLKTSRLNKLLKSLGYTTIAFENRASGHFDLKEDVLLSPRKLVFGRFDFSGGLTEFESILINSSALKLFVDTETIPRLTQAVAGSKYNDHYQETLFILSRLKDIQDLGSPKFVFAHIMVPHRPFIFSPDGNFRYAPNFISGYRDNSIFIDHAILPAIETIIRESSQPPVIILLGDHGAPTTRRITENMRMFNLGAYYVNEQAQEQLYESITPVNAVRVIMNQYFDQNYELVDDLSYYAYKLKQLESAKLIQNTCE